jgi:hypothetical protein
MENSLLVLDPKEIEKRKTQYIPILREMIVNGKKLTDEQIIGRAAFAAQQGLDPISEVHTMVDKEGKTMGHTMAITAFRRKCQEQAGYSVRIDKEFVEMTQEYMKRMPGALIGFECRLRVGSDYVQWQKALVEVGRAFREAGVPVTFNEIMQVVGPAPVHTGIGIVYTGELNEWKDRNFNPIERAKKRAEVNALNKRFSKNAPVYDGDNAHLVSDDEVDAPAVFSYGREQAIDELFGGGEETISTAAIPATIQEAAAELGGDTFEVAKPKSFMTLDMASREQQRPVIWRL